MTTTQQIKGQQAEIKACFYLESHGLLLIEKNYRCRHGEIDLIMHDQQVLAFIEVRFRHQQNYGHSIETVQPIKQRRIIRSALHYLQHSNLYEQVDCRFDVIGIDVNNSITWIKDAFQI